MNLKMFVIIILMFPVYLFSLEIDSLNTIERKKIVILATENGDNNIIGKIYQIASTVATDLGRFDVLDRNQLSDILNEQKLQYSGIADLDKAVEIGKIASANQALIIKINNFGQRGVPINNTEDKKEPKVGLLGWIVKEVVKAEIDKNSINIEKYPNNINTIIDGEVALINIENNKSISSFNIYADYTGGIKEKSLSRAFKQIRYQLFFNLKQIYQLDSEVLEVDNDRVTLLLGNDMGVKAGDKFEIITPNINRSINGRDISIPGKTVGFVEIQKVSQEISIGKVLRKWSSMSPGYQAHEFNQSIVVSGISSIYGIKPNNLRLRFFTEIYPFNRYYGELHGDIGIVTDSRGDKDLHFGLGISFNYKIFYSHKFSVVPILNLPIDFHIRLDDGNARKESHLVFLPIISPRVGLKLNYMLSPKLDILLTGEYILSSANLGNEWRYTEKNDGPNSNAKTMLAYWNGIPPEINYQGWVVTLGFRRTFFSGFSFN